ncbi:MAG TPA: hypothetical protein VFQ61_11140 [Polyangiaceae bacterium]|nr:hypothetical protein [Polyangiaceae bacterium]
MDLDLEIAHEGVPPGAPTTEARTEEARVAPVKTAGAHALRGPRAFEAEPSRQLNDANSTQPNQSGEFPVPNAQTNPRGAELTPSNEGTERRESRPGLSAEQLGIAGTNPFVTIPSRPTETPAGRARREQRELSARVERSLTDVISAQDQKRGLGPEGAVLRTLEAEVLASNTAPNSSAVFDAMTDTAGYLVGLQLVEANSDSLFWHRLAESTLSRLGKQRLRGSHGKNGLTLRIRVTSRIALPSGRDPGLAIDAFGLPIKKGAGKRSSRLSLFDVKPQLKSTETTLPDGRVISTPTLQLFSLGRLEADPADIGAQPRRMVHAHVERSWQN